jgi:hypothetical protein
MRISPAIAALCLNMIARVCAADDAIFDPDPSHPWNRLWQMFYAVPELVGHRFGPEELDLPLGPDTDKLLSGPRHGEALSLLDAFIGKDQGSLVNDPLRRAVLQRDLWEAFDWVANPAGDHPTERRALQHKLAKIIEQLALSAEEIRALPDNYKAAVNSRGFPASYDKSTRNTPFLPPDLLAADGPWVLLTDSHTLPTARRHVEFAEGRSVFRVYLNLPGGRQRTLDYVKKLMWFPEPWIWEPNFPTFPYARSPVALNPALPQFPQGTMVALLRQPILIDNHGNLVPARLTESVQFRVYRLDPKGAEYSDPANQDMFEFRLRREDLFAGRTGGLRIMAIDEEDFSNTGALFGQGGRYPQKPLKPAAPLATCQNCHAGVGIFSVMTYTRTGGPATRRTPWLEAGRFDWEAKQTIQWKQQHYSWGLLRGLCTKRP